MVKTKSRFLYWALIGTFATLYLAVAAVSTLHAVTFFQLANTLTLAILLGAAYEIGQAAVLFSILMTENKNRLLAWAMMFLLTALQVTANVYASFKFMDASASQDWTYWQRAILFGIQDQTPETYKVIISWISGALLPIVALGMTALVAENIKLVKGEGAETEKEEEKPEVPVDEIIENEVQKRLEEERLKELKSLEEEEARKIDEMQNKIKEKYDQLSEADKRLESYDNAEVKVLKKPIEVNLQDKPDFNPHEEFKMNQPLIGDNKPLPQVDPSTSPLIYGDFDKAIEVKAQAVNLEVEEKPLPTVELEFLKLDENGEVVITQPVNKVRGWHFKNEYIDDDGNVFKKGKYSHTLDKKPEKKPEDKSPPSKKV